MKSPWMFVCNRGDTVKYHVGLEIIKLGIVPLLAFLTSRQALSSCQDRTLVCLILVRRRHCAHLPANPTTAC